MLCELVLDFAKNSTLHGLRYFTEGLTALEKIFWAIIFLTSVVLCVWAMSNTWVKWQTSPIIISVDDHLMSASEVPFPAVTICPQTKINQFEFNYTDNWITFSKMTRKIYGDKVIPEDGSEEKAKRMKKFMDENQSMYDLANVALICDTNFNSLAISNLAPYVRADTLVQDIIKAAPDANVVYYGTWRNTPIKETMFDTSQIAPVLTQEGICFTFNGLATEEIFHMDRIQKNYSYLNATVPEKGWSLEHGYFNSTGHDVYPRRGQASGYKKDLELTLREYNETQDPLCDYVVRGYKVYVHHPADLPQTSPYHYMAQPNEDVTFAIKINVVTTSDSLINYPPLSRQCYFPSEKSLRYFRAYTPSNCQLECLTNHTLARCGCVFFHMPRYDGALCISLDQRACFINALSEYSAAEDGFGNLCHCLPSCYSVQYEAEVTKSYSDFTRKQMVYHRVNNEVDNTSHPFSDIWRQYSITRLGMYFKEARFATMRRSELYGPTDFLASCGGLLGLFLGFSFLSLVEFFYFFTISIFWAIIVVTSVVLCVWAMSNTWVKWQTSPIIISVDDHLMSASEVPFPAVTFCPQIKVDQSKFNYTESWITFWKNYNRIEKEKVTKEEQEKRMQKFMDETRFMYDLVNVNVICNEYINGNAYFAQYTRADTLVQSIIQAAIAADDIVSDNKWRNTYFDATDKAQIAPALTQEGLCFTFNSLATEEIFQMDRIQKNYSYLYATASRKGWSLEHGYFNSTGHDVYPRRGQASGYKEDLLLVLREFSYRRDLLCDHVDQGYKVYFHHPADLPQTSLNHYMVQPEERVAFAIKINVVTTSDSLINYPPQTRQCYFPSEKSLRYFKAYTPSNCRLECLTNHTLARCGCVFFHMPRYDSALCISLDQRLCFFDALSEYSAAEDSFGNFCHCLPSCYSVQYEAEVTKNKFDATPFDRVRHYAVNEVYNESGPYEIDDHIKDAHLKIYFKEARFATMRRSELYGPTDFLASCGGLLGLFLGFSFLSLVEFFYFFTIRLGCMFREKKVPDAAKQTDDVDKPNSIKIHVIERKAKKETH